LQWGGFSSAPFYSAFQSFLSGYPKLTIANDRRSRNDRRKQAGINIRLLTGSGERRTIRRQGDRNRHFFVDQYSPWFFFVILVIVLLSVTDGLLTLFLINHGAYETNPVMAYCLKIGPFAFIAVKYALTSMGVLILLIFRNIVLRRIKVRAHSLFYWVIGVFMAVVVWEFYLIFDVVI